jgi:hypothetical protein
MAFAAAAVAEGGGCAVKDAFVSPEAQLRERLRVQELLRYVL